MRKGTAIGGAFDFLQSEKRESHWLSRLRFN